MTMNTNPSDHWLIITANPSGSVIESTENKDKVIGQLGECRIWCQQCVVCTVPNAGIRIALLFCLLRTSCVYWSCASISMLRAPCSFTPISGRSSRVLLRQYIAHEPFHHHFLIFRARTYICAIDTNSAMRFLWFWSRSDEVSHWWVRSVIFQHIVLSDLTRDVQISWITCVTSRGIVYIFHLGNNGIEDNVKLATHFSKECRL